MVKRTIKYTDYFGVEREEDFYFSITAPELIEWEREDPTGSLAKKLEGIVNSENPIEILGIIRWIVMKSYGVRSEDGRFFKKSDEISEMFTQSAAYEEMYISFLENPELAIEFINSVIPKKLPKNVSMELQKMTTT